jgi:hypothetical protein
MLTLFEINHQTGVGRNLPVNNASRATTTIWNRLRQHPTHNSCRSAMILCFPKPESSDKLQTTTNSIVLVTIIVSGIFTVLYRRHISGLLLKKFILRKALNSKNRLFVWISTYYLPSDVKKNFKSP